MVSGFCLTRQEELSNLRGATRWYLVRFVWTAGEWRYANEEDVPDKLIGLDCNGERCILARLSTEDARTTLGVDVAPDGNCESQGDRMLAQSRTRRDQMRTGKLGRYEAWLPLTSTLWKALEYPLPALTLTKEQYRKIMAPALTSGNYLLDSRQPQTSDNAAHVDAQAISICIQGTRVTGRYEDAIRESIDGSYLRQYLSDKHALSDSTWSCIDWYSHERHLKVLNGASLYQRLKFIHDWQCTNSQKFKFTKSDDASIGLCPCCKTTPEDHVFIP